MVPVQSFWHVSVRSLRDSPRSPSFHSSCWTCPWTLHPETKHNIQNLGQLVKSCITSSLVLKMCRKGINQKEIYKSIMHKMRKKTRPYHSHHAEGSQGTRLWLQKDDNNLIFATQLQSICSEKCAKFKIEWNDISTVLSMVLKVQISTCMRVRGCWIWGVIGNGSMPNDPKRLLIWCLCAANGSL